MLSIREIEEKAKLDNLKQRLEYLDRDLKFGTITKKQYEKESMLIGKELAELEAIHHKEIFDNMMGNPIEQIDNLIEQAQRLVKWSISLWCR